jgi:hypothetical protein
MEGERKRDSASILEPDGVPADAKRRATGNRGFSRTVLDFFVPPSQTSQTTPPEVSRTSTSDVQEHTKTDSVESEIRDTATTEHFNTNGDLAEIKLGVGPTDTAENMEVDNDYKEPLPKASGKEITEQMETDGIYGTAEYVDSASRSRRGAPRSIDAKAVVAKLRDLTFAPNQSIEVIFSLGQEISRGLRPGKGLLGTPEEEALLNREIEAARNGTSLDIMPRGYCVTRFYSR